MILPLKQIPTSFTRPLEKDGIEKIDIIENHTDTMTSNHTFAEVDITIAPYLILAQSVLHAIVIQCMDIFGFKGICPLTKPPAILKNNLTRWRSTFYVKELLQRR